MRKDIDLIKQKLRIEEFLRSYLQLIPAGKNLKALCPFHQEKTPSFIVSPDRQMWHCFGCGEGGDIFKFVMRYENIDFPEALRFLAERAGVSIQMLNPAQQREFGVLYDIQEDAAEFYKRHIATNELAKKYLAKRGLKQETIDEFSIGYAPGEDALIIHLLKKGYDVNDIVRAGLAYKNTKGLYRDRFEKRIIFPIWNAMGKVVAFTGRALEGENETVAKYINSPETPIFIKSKILYGFSHAKRAIAESRSAFLVEGQMDFLMAWQSGIKNTIAVSGTALTKDHLESLRRFADTVVVSFDNDTAGFKALERSIELFGTFDFFVKAISLGNYKDPAEACEHDPTFLVSAIQNALPAFEHLLNYYFPDSTLEDIPLVKRVTRHLLQMIVRIQSPLEKERWIREISKKAEIQERTLQEEFAKIEAATKQEEENTHAKKPLLKEKKSRKRIISERLLLIAFTDPEFSSILKASYKGIFPEIFLNMLSEETSENEEIATLRMKASYEFSDISKKALTNEFHDLIKQLLLENKKEQMEVLRKELKRAEQLGNIESIAEKTKAFQVLSKEIHELQKSIQKK